MEPFPDIPGYTIEKRLAKGRLTNVYQAEKTDTSQMVVIKVLLPELIEAENDKFVKRFLYEARNAAKLDHPNIGKILDVGESGDHYYFARPYYPQSLRERIVNKNLSVDMEETELHDLLDIFRQLFDALDYAQQEDAVHRDIRPENILFTEDGTPLFTDFYMSELVKASESLKEKGITVSTPQYTSPEQVLRKTVDTGSDIYSLGVTIYEMLTNNVPYDGDVALAIENQHIMEPIPRLPGALSLFQPLIERMMAKAKEDRAQSGAELILLLEELSEKFSEASMETEMGEEVELELGQELKKELEMEKGLDLDLNLSPEPEKKPMLQGEEPSGKWEALKTQATQAADGAGGLMEKLPAPKILIPAAAGIIIIILVVIFVLPSGTPETVETVEPPKTKETAPKQETAKPPQLSPEEQQQRDILYTQKFKLAQRDFNSGKYDKAQEHLSAAEKGKTTKESEALKQKIQAKLAEKEDNKAFKQAAAANTAAAYEEYLNKYASGRHAEEAREKITAFKEEEQKREAQRKKWAASRVTLRSTPATLKRAEVRAMAEKWNFFDKYYNKGGKFKNHFELHVIDGRKLVLDNATGLMWLQGGSSDYMNQKKARQWVADLNREKYAGFSDWRLPTLEEAASLMKSTETRAGLFVDPVFASEQQHIWTGDKFDENKSWAVDFFGGDFNDVNTTTDSFVRAVRSQTK